MRRDLGYLGGGIERGGGSAAPPPSLSSPAGHRLPEHHTYHQVLLGDDLLLGEHSEPLGLLLQLPPQHRVALRADRDQMAPLRQAELFQGNLDPTFWLHIESARIEASLGFDPSPVSHRVSEMPQQELSPVGQLSYLIVTMQIPYLVGTACPAA